MRQLLEHVKAEVRSHCAAKGYRQEPGFNPLAPRDCVAALAMARFLTGTGRFDHYVAVAPEGHVYGYFFERLGAATLSVFVDWPPTGLTTSDDLGGIKGGNVLILEDDVISGLTLGFVTAELQQHAPRTLSLYLGRDKDYQQLQNVPAVIERPIYFAEDCLDPALRPQYEAEFLEFFGFEAA